MYIRAETNPSAALHAVINPDMSVQSPIVRQQEVADPQLAAYYNEWYGSDHGFEHVEPIDRRRAYLTYVLSLLSMGASVSWDMPTGETVTIDGAAAFADGLTVEDALQAAALMRVGESLNYPVPEAC